MVSVEVPVSATATVPVTVTAASTVTVTVTARVTVVAMATMPAGVARQSVPGQYIVMAYIT